MFRSSKRTMFGAVWRAWLLVMALAARTACGTEYFVDAGRPDDTGAGTTWAAAKKTIAAALAMPTPTIVYVKDGTYAITSTIVMASGCQLLGGYAGSTPEPGARGVEPATNCIVDGSSTCTVFLVSNCVAGTQIDGFTIRNGRVAGNGGGIYIYRSTNTISRNKIVSNKTYNAANYNGAGMYLAAGSSVVISNNIIANNSASWGQNTYGGGIYSTASDTIMVNNTVHSNLAAASYAGAIYLSGGTHQLKNNIVAVNYYSGIRAASATVTLSYNNVWGNNTYAGQSNYYGLSAGSNDISLNPYLAGGDDYHPQSRQGSYHNGAWTADINHSPCIDAGNPADAVGDEPAPNGGRINMGAYGGTAFASLSYTSSPAARYVRPVTDTWTPAAPYTNWATAAAAIQTAINAAETNDPIYVKSGTYLITNGAITMRTVRLMGGYDGAGSPGSRSLVPADNCIIDANRTNRVFYCDGCAAGTRIDGFTIRNGAVTNGTYGAGFYAFMSDMVISSNKILNHRASGAPSGSGYGGGFYLESGCKVFFDHNVLASNDAVYGGGLSRGGAVQAINSDLVFVNNTIVNNRSTYGGALYLSAGNAVLSNNIVAENLLYQDGAISVNSGGAIQFSYNNVWGNSIAGYYGCSPGSNDISRNPYLVGGDDYHLQSRQGSYHNGAWTADINHSPCIDAGNPADAVGAEPAPNGGRINMGAYGGTAVASLSYTSSPAARYARPATDTWTPAAPYTNWATAAAAIQTAINAAEENDPVYVKIGTYLITNGAITMRTVRLMGGYLGSGEPGSRNETPAENCILDAKSSNRVFSCSGCETGSLINGFTITGGKTTGTMYGAGLYFVNDATTLRNCRIVSNRLSGANYIYGAGMYIDNQSPVSVLANVIAYNDATASWSGGGGIANGDVSYNGSSNALIANNNIYSNRAGIYGGGGLYARKGRIINNTLWLNTAADGVGGVYAQYAAVSNNIIASNSPYGLNLSGAGASGNYNNVWGNLPGNYTNCSASGNDISADPLFMNSGTWDLRLSVGSPCVNAGIPVGIFVDFYGNRRPLLGAYDIGAHEYPPHQGTIFGVR